MRILLDTNILISAALFPNGTAAKAYIKAVTYGHSSFLRKLGKRKDPHTT